MIKSKLHGRTRPGTWRAPQPGLHALILFLLGVALFPDLFHGDHFFQESHPVYARTLDREFAIAPAELCGSVGDHRYLYYQHTLCGGRRFGWCVDHVSGGRACLCAFALSLKEQLYFGILILLAVPWVLSFIPSYMLFSDLGMMNTPWVLIIPNLANGPVFGIFLMRAVIEGIPEELYEAARCDGASLGREIFSITLPLALPGLATLAIVNFVGTWNWFLWPLVTITDRANQLISVGSFC